MCIVYTNRAYTHKIQTRICMNIHHKQAHKYNLEEHKQKDISFRGKTVQRNTKYLLGKSSDYTRSKKSGFSIFTCF